MNFKEAFNNDCKKITASDELRNRTLMAATTSSKEDKVMKKTVKTRRNTFHLNVPAICTALAVAVIAVIVIAFNAINNNSNVKTTAAFKVYAGEKYLFANLRQEYSASYDDFQHVYLACTLPNINNINSTLTITVEYNDGTVVSKNYSATAYLSEYYLFIYEMK